jgi:hypothetical protein
MKKTENPSVPGTPYDKGFFPGPLFSGADSLGLAVGGPLLRQDIS